MSSKTGKDCKVTLTANKIAGIGDWSMGDFTTEMIPDTEFGDQYGTVVPGIKSAGQVSFSGFYDPDDSDGQEELQSAWRNGADIANLRLYINTTSYWTLMTTNPLSKANVSAFNIGSEKGGLIEISFTLDISGMMELI